MKIRGQITLLLTLIAILGHAQEPPAWPPDERTLATLLDPLLDREMARRNIPGAVCVVVADGRLVFAKGYGVTDSDTKQPVDPATTVFRLASVSKVFAAVAVMQLVEQGKLDLHADVNSYLKKLELPQTYPDPVTLDHLLTHTGGFDDRYLGMGARTEADLPPLGDYLARRMPPRVMPSGRYFSYSNHGFALAGHVVEQISDLPFPEYAQRFIFNPLGMTHSTFIITPEIQRNLATGYADFRGTRSQVPIDAPQTVPASSLAATGRDMANFMIAMLQLGRFGNTRILGEAAARDMQATHFTQRQGLPGRAYAFEERFENGLRVLEHGGHIFGFISEMILIPEKNTGLFMSYNTQETGMDNAVLHAFYNRFFPAKPEPAIWTTPPGWETRRQGIGGCFRINRYARTTFVKFGTIATEVVSEVRLASGEKPGSLHLAYFDSFGRTRPSGELIEVEPDYYRRLDRNGSDDPKDWSFANKPRVALERDAEGRVTCLFVDGRTYERMRWFEHRHFLLACIAFALLAPLSWLLAIPLRRWSRRGHPVPETAWSRRICRLATVTVLGQVAFLAGFALFLLLTIPNEVGYGPPPALIAVLSIPLCILAGEIALLTGIAVAWMRGEPGTLRRIHLTLVTLGLAVFLALLHYWNLLGYRFG